MGAGQTTGGCDRTPGVISGERVVVAVASFGCCALTRAFDGFGASLENVQVAGTGRHVVVCVSRATVPAERSWTVLGLEAGSIV